MFNRQERNSSEPDYILVFVFLLILLFGIVMLSSASTAVAYEKFKDTYHYVRHQLIFGVIPGLIVCYSFSKFHYAKWKNFAFPLLITSIILLLMVFLPGIGSGFLGARRWINLGGILFQPAEIVKLFFLLYLAYWLEKRSDTKLKSFTDGVIPFLTVLGVIMFLIILQPDVGTASIIVLISLIVYYIAGAPLKHIAGMLVSGVLFLAILIKIAPYRAARFTVFLHPELDPQGIGYHINQALLAIGSGGIWGLGFGKSRQKHLYLPEVVGDSIFAVMAEELGFIIMTGLVMLYLVIMYRGFKIAKNAPDKYGKFLAVGITSWICLQAFVNIAAMLNLMPLTGLPLPFISYGSSSLVILLAAMGILINISRYSNVDNGKSLYKR